MPQKQEQQKRLPESSNSLPNQRTEIPKQHEQRPQSDLVVEKPLPGHKDPPLVNQGLDKNGNPTKGPGEPLKKDPVKKKDNAPLLENKEVANASKSSCCVIF